MNKLIAIVALSLLALPVAATPLWQSAGNTTLDNGTVVAYEVNISSVHYESTSDGERYVIATTRATVTHLPNAGESGVAFYNNGVSVKHCRSKQGLLITIPVDGSKASSNNFVFDGGTIGSRLAEMLCSFDTYMLKQPTRAVPSI